MSDEEEDFEGAPVEEVETEEASSPADLQLATQILIYLEHELGVDMRRIHVKAKGGWVHLQGGVASLNLKNEIESNLRGWPKIRDVANYLSFDSND